MPPLSAAVPSHFFFYGTLVAGNPNPVAAAIHAAFDPLGPGVTIGALHAIPDAAGWFPALVAGEGAVTGMLYRARPGFDAGLLARMDAYEDYDPADPAGSLYRREAIAVRDPGGAAVEAAAYLWNRPLPSGSRTIAGGNFANWLAQSGNAVFDGLRNA